MKSHAGVSDFLDEDPALALIATDGGGSAPGPGPRGGRGMNREVLEKVLACDRLPTLPAVAVRVIELTQDRDVSFRDLAETIQNDPALAARVIRTVNSSFFGLRQPCSSINQAIVLLGLSAVKTLALGFSLVSAISGAGEGEEGEDGGQGAGFDYPAYWRRSLFTGIAARTLARHGAPGREEVCFLGGLLQDVGMLALHQALGTQYAELLDQAGGDHRRLFELEIGALDTHHADIGAMLASRWRLPEELVMPIKYHERPSAAPAPHLPVVRAVGLGNIASDVLTAPEPAGPLSRFHARAREWFGLEDGEADEVLRSISASTREIARLLQIDAGEVADAGAILKQAHQRLLEMTIPAAPTPGVEAPDALTGLPGRIALERALIAAFAQAAGAGTPLAVALFDIDFLDEFNDRLSREAGDAVVAALGAALPRELAGARGHAFRDDEGRFALVMPRTDRLTSTRIAESVRRHFGSSPVETPQGPVEASVSVGLAWADAGSIRQFKDAGDLMAAALRALDAAKRAGRNTLRLYTAAA